MARMVTSSGRSRRSRPRISAPICLVSGTTSNLVLVIVVIVFSSIFLVSEGQPHGSLLGGSCLRLGMMRRLAVLDFAGGKRGQDLLDQRARRFGVQLTEVAVVAAEGDRLSEHTLAGHTDVIPDD